MTKGVKIGIIVVVVVGLAVGGYFLYKKLNSDGTDENDNSTDEQEPQGTPAPVSSDSSLEPTPFKNQGQGDYFRLWVNRYYPTDAKKLDLSKTGKIDNDFIRKAWTKFGVLYKQQVVNWNKITNNIPSAFSEKFDKKDSYNFKIMSDGKIALIPKRTYPNSEGFQVVFYSDGTWKLQAKTDSKQKMASGKWWDGGKQANFDYPTSIKKNVKGSNFFDLAKILSDSTEKSSFNGITYRQSLDLENNFID